MLGNTPLICKLINPGPKFRTTSTRCLHSRSQYSSALSHLGPGSDNWRPSFWPRACQHYSNEPLLSCFPALVCLSHGKHNPGFGSCFFHTSPAPWSNLVLSPVTLHGMACPLLSGNVRNKNHLSMAFVSPGHHSVTLMNEILWEQLIQVANAWWVMGNFLDGKVFKKEN